MFQVTMAGVTFAFLAFVLTVAQAAVMYTNNVTFDGGNYKLYYTYKAEEDRLYFKVKANATGWVGLGFSDKNTTMMNLDCVVGGVYGNTSYIMDLKADGQVKPSKDSEQNYNLTSTLEMDGYTTIEFNRKKNTGDTKDTLFEDGGMVYLAWAYQKTEDAQMYVNLTKHSYKGYSEKVTLVPMIPTTMSNTTVATSTSKGSHAYVWSPFLLLLFVLLSLFQ